MLYHGICSLKENCGINERGLFRYPATLKKVSVKSIKCIIFFALDNLIQKKQCINSFQILEILPWLLQRSKRCHGHYSMIYHAMFQWVTRSDIHLSFLAQRKEICGFKIQNHNNYMLISRFRCGVD